MPVPYHLLAVLSILATGPVDGLAKPLTRLWDAKTVMHSWGAVPQYWADLGHPPAGAAIDLYLALNPEHKNALIDALLEVSNPRHPKYGAHLSKEQVAKCVAPHTDTLNTVNSWLADHGILPSSVSMRLGGNWLKVSGVPVPQANDILGASYQLYRHVETNVTVLRTVSYSLPDVLQGHIQTVAPTTYFGPPRAHRRKPRILSKGEAAAWAKAGSGSPVTVLPRSDTKFVTPAYLGELYKTTGYVPAAVDQNLIGIGGYAKQYPSPQDLKIFMKTFRTDGENALYSVVDLNGGGYDPDNPGVEANLDIQFTEAMTFPTLNIYYSTGGVPGTAEDPYLKWLEFVLDQTSVPQTITTSYSSNEYDVPPGLAGQLCILFAQLGARGVSVLFSSGDWGVGSEGCVVKPGSGNVARFLPQFPASCPWVTSVGGTTDDSPEVAASISGGGFSNYFPRPPYQVNAVPPFLQNIGNMNWGLFYPSGRGLPDISAQARNFVMVQNGKYWQRDGTSGSVAVVAGIISLLNDYLISHEKQPLGFLNPWLYEDGLEGLNDIINGWNPGCGTNGFPAITGWDPVTGLGTLDFTKLGGIIAKWKSIPPPNMVT
ncbi:subtilisin-like protein [Lactarius indigo]|nr:subtilisin-like protein [Lactarius indigo]